MAFVDAAGGIDRVRERLSRSLGIDTDQTIEQIEREIVEGPFLPVGEWLAAADACATGSSNDKAQSKRLRDALTCAGAERVNAYLSVFITDKGTPRSSVITATHARKHADLADRLAQERERIVGLHARRRGACVRDRTAALLAIAVEIIARYRAEKDRSGLLDYDDLIDKTRALLDRVDAAWVHYKLDLGIDHLLIDEAQDTSEEQWEIVKKLVAEFTAGIGARGAMERSIFAVGDEKQSIFSFQGAALEAFADVGRAFGRAHHEAGLPFFHLEFKHSFRSQQVVLDAVDEVFMRPQAFAGLSTDEAPTAHVAVREHGPGFVELWELVEPDDKPEVEAWDAPFDTTSETNPRAKLARMIAGSIRTWIARGETIGSGDDRHAVRPGDILILVRQRGPLFEAIIRALKDFAIPVAGADRLVLTEHIAVMDLLVLADALLLEQDDLALATVLKSPLFGLSEDELFALAWNRRGSLRAALRERHPGIATTLDARAADAATTTPFDFYARLLGAQGGRRRFVARLGTEANDALDEFLNLALDYESRETPSLQGFVAWMRTASADIKRDMEIARDEVRVMTVHGAKGLEAPIVILADTTTPPTGPPQYQPRLLALQERDATGCFAWMPNRNDEIEPIAQARARATAAVEDEYRRLLYVAMTRAADRLVICGALGKQAMPSGCWYQLVQDGLAASEVLVQEPADHGDGTVLRFRTSSRQASTPAPPQIKQMTLELAPAWLNRSVPAEPEAEVVLTPSRSAARDPQSRDVAADATRRTALLRGTLVHRLLQSLPDIAPARRADVARAFLVRAARDLAAEHDVLVAQVIRLLDDARFKPLFAAGSRAEVPIVGRLATATGSQIVSGQIDRLVVTADAVMIADYKTDRPAPQRPDDVPRGYLRQLALYRALLARIYPGRSVRAALIWTDVPDLMELSEQALEREMALLTCL
jgi:ATP-dependent helicase/nuclease subunit A